MGRSRGGVTTTIHALVDAEGRPIRLKLTEGQAHDGASARHMLDGIVAGQTLIADGAYDANWLRETMMARGVWPKVRALSTRKDSCPFSARLYRQRNAAERFFNKLKHLHAVAPVTTSAMATSSHRSSSTQSASGCETMTRWLEQISCCEIAHQGTWPECPFRAAG